jgi:hypothetical protein
MSATARKAVFLLSKSPYGRRQDGETVVSRLLLEAAAEACETSAIALVPGDDPATSGGPLRELHAVRKPPLRLLPTALASLRRRRSAIHTRFSPRELVEAVARTEADVIVARRLYMAQAALDAGRVPPRDELVAIADVLESDVMRASRPWLALEARRTRRDEVRCAKAASRVAALSDTEVGALRSELGASPSRLDLVLPPTEQPARLEDPVALFIGDLSWAPNRRAAEELERIWPRIGAAAPGARLEMVGPGTERGPADDIDAVFASAGVLLAPVDIGGGVRVKILDAASRGVPVVATPAAVGSVGSYLPVSAHSSTVEFTDAATALLADTGARRRAGGELYEANRALAADGFVERQVAGLLTPPR